MTRFLTAVIATLSLFGVALAGAQTPPPPAAAASTPAAASVSADYKLGIADKVRIIVFDEPTLSGEFVVNANGSLSVPLIGDVPAAGRAVASVRDDIQTKFAAGYLRNPRVSMDVLNYRPFYILGEVNKPGEYPYSNGLTVLNAVAIAQGFTYRANKRKVMIKAAGGTEVTKMLDASTPVAPGDTIRIGERYF
jgi:protein involved in polysaccharide export with SLBB domain